MFGWKMRHHFLGGDNTSTHSNVVAFPASHVRFSRGVMSNLFMPMLSAYQNNKIPRFYPSIHQVSGSKHLFYPPTCGKTAVFELNSEV